MYVVHRVPRISHACWHVKFHGLGVHFFRVLWQKTAGTPLVTIRNEASVEAYIRQPPKSFSRQNLLRAAASPSNVAFRTGSARLEGLSESST